MSMDADINGDQEQENGMNELSMEQLMESSLQSLKEGEVVHGTVVAIDGPSGAGKSTVARRLAAS